LISRYYSWLSVDKDRLTFHWINACNTKEKRTEVKRLILYLLKRVSSKWSTADFRPSIYLRVNEITTVTVLTVITRVVEWIVSLLIYLLEVNERACHAIITYSTIQMIVESNNLMFLFVSACLWIVRCIVKAYGNFDYCFWYIHIRKGTSMTATLETKRKHIIINRMTNGPLGCASRHILKKGSSSSLYCAITL